MSFRGFGGREHHDKFSAFRERIWPNDTFFVYLANFAMNKNLSFDQTCQFIERSAYSMRRLKEDLGLRISRDCLQPPLPVPSRSGRKAAEAEAIAGDAGCRQRRRDRAWPR